MISDCPSKHSHDLGLEPALSLPIKLTGGGGGVGIDIGSRRGCNKSGPNKSGPNESFAAEGEGTGSCTGYTPLSALNGK